MLAIVPQSLGEVDVQLCLTDFDIVIHVQNWAWMGEEFGCW